MSVQTVPQLSQLRALEAEAVHIMREVAAQLERPVSVVALPATSAEARREARELHALASLPFVDLHVADGEPAERTAERVLDALS